MYPIMFTIPGINLPIYSYGVMLGLSLVVGWYLVIGLGGRDGLPREWMSNCYVVTAISAIVGARLLYILTNLEEFDDPRKMLEFRQGGLVAYGGFLGGFLGSWWYAKRRKVSLLAWADAVVPSLATGLIITRIGCLLYGCDFGGKITKSDPGWLRAMAIKFPNWATRFPDLHERFAGGSGCSGSLDGSPAFVHHVKTYGLDAGSSWSFAVHPTQLYESTVGLLLFSALMLVRLRFRRFTGQLFFVFVILYGIIRSLIELLRDDAERGAIGPFSTSQIIGTMTAVLAMYGYWYFTKRAREKPAQAFWQPPAPSGAAPLAAKRRRPRRK